MMPLKTNDFLKYSIEIALVSILFLVLTCLLLFANMNTISDRLFGGVEGGDKYQFVWTAHWWEKSISAGRDPNAVDELFYPFGTDFRTLPCAFIQSVIFIPLRHLLRSDVRAYNSLFILSFLLTGVCTYLLARSAVDDKAFSILAAILFTFASQRIEKSFGSPLNMHVEWLPLFLLVWIKFIRTPAPLLAVLSALVFVTAGLSNEYFLLYLIPIAALSAIFFLKPGAAREFAIGGLIFILVAASLLFPFYGHVLSGKTSGLTRPYWEVAQNSARLGDYLLPRPWQTIGNLSFADTKDYQSVSDESANYLGLVLLVTLIPGVPLMVAKRRSSREFWFFSLAGLAFVLISLGPEIRIGNIAVPGVYRFLMLIMPFYGKVRGVFRFGIMVALCFSILAGLILCQTLKKIPKRKRWLITALLAITCVLDTLPLPYPAGNEVPRFSEQEFAQTYGDKAAPLVDLPIFPSGAYSAGEYLFLQTIHGRKIMGGYTSFPTVEFDRFVLQSPFVNLAVYEKADPWQPERDIFDLPPSLKELFMRYRLERAILHKKIANAYIDEHNLLAYRDYLEKLFGTAPDYENPSVAVWVTDSIPEPRTPSLVSYEGFFGLERAQEQLWRWIGEEAVIQIHDPTGEIPRTLYLDASSYPEAMDVDLFVNGSHARRITVVPGLNTYLAPIQFTQGLNSLRLVPEKCTVPAEVGNSPDERCLSIQVFAVAIQH